MMRGTLIALIVAVPTVAEAQRNCRLLIEPYPAIQLSLVSKQCWTTPAKTITEALPLAPVPKPKPLIQVASVKKAVKRSACGSKRQVWRRLANGHRKYRCK